MPTFVVLVNPNCPKEMVKMENFNQTIAQILKNQEELTSLEAAASFIYIGSIAEGILLNESQERDLKQWCKYCKYIQIMTDCMGNRQNHLVQWIQEVL